MIEEDEEDYMLCPYCDGDLTFVGTEMLVQTFQCTECGMQIRRFVE